MSQPVMNHDEAYDVLVAEVHAPVFFEKLARVYGIVPQNPTHARDLLQMAGYLRNVHDNETTKEAAAQGNLVSEAKQDLERFLSQFGYQPLPDNDPNVKQAAYQMATNPLVKEASLVFQHYLATQQ